MTSTLFIIISVLAAGVCVFTFFEAIEKMDTQNTYNDSFGLLVALAGFSVFPVINIIAATLCVIWWANGFKPFNILD